jgi:hypothetical protein
MPADPIDATAAACSNGATAGHRHITPDFAPGPVLRRELENEIANWTRFIDAHGTKPE